MVVLFGVHFVNDEATGVHVHVYMQNPISLSLVSHCT